MAVKFHIFLFVDSMFLMGFFYYLRTIRLSLSTPCCSPSRPRYLLFILCITEIIIIYNTRFFDLKALLEKYLINPNKAMINFLINKFLIRCSSSSTSPGSRPTRRWWWDAKRYWIHDRSRYASNSSTQTETI